MDFIIPERKAVMEQMVKNYFMGLSTLGMNGITLENPPTTLRTYITGIIGTETLSANLELEYGLQLGKNLLGER